METLTDTKQMLKQKQGKTPTYLLVISTLLLVGSLHAQTQMTGINQSAYPSNPDKTDKHIVWLKVNGSNNWQDGGEYFVHTASPLYSNLGGASAVDEDGISIFSRNNEMLRLTNEAIFFATLRVKHDQDGSAFIGRAKIGAVGHSDYAGFSHLDQAAAGSYALIQHHTGETMLNAATGQLLSFRNNNTDRMILYSDGKFGIGTARNATVNEYLEVMPGQDQSALIGQAHVGNMTGFNSYAGFSHSSQDGSSYALLQSSVGKTFLNAASGQSLNFRINNLDKMTMDTDGNFGIGTASPSEMLHVSSGTSGDARILLEADTDNSDENDNPMVQFRQDGGANGINIGFDEPNFGPNRFGIGRRFGTDYWDSFTIDITNGNVGVGTSAPSANLHVNHDLHIAANSGGWNTTAGKGISMRYSTNGGQDAAYVQSIDAGTSTYYPMQLDASSYFLARGKVGIGMGASNTLTEYLEVMPDQDESGVVGRAHIGHKGYTDFAGFSHYDHSSGVDYAFGQWASGFTAINAPSGQTIGFRINNEEKMTLSSDGNVGIGTDPTATANAAFKLAVDGHVKAKEVEVNVSGWPDYVFADEYTLQPLEEVEDFIAANKHLPNVPSEKEVEENGVKLGEMDAVLLRKIEELTLYVIDLKKELEEVKKNK